MQTQKITELVFPSKFKPHQLVHIQELSRPLLESVKVSGGSRFVYLNPFQIALNIDYENLNLVLSKYLVQEEVLQIAKIDAEQKIVYSLEYEPSLEIGGIWVHATHPSCENWMHILSEIMPTVYTTFSKTEKPIGLILDSDLPDSAKQLFNLLFDNSPKIYLRRGQTVLVEKLIPVQKDFNSSCFFWPRNFDHINGTFNFNSEELLRCREQIWQRTLSFEKSSSVSRKIFIKRSSSFRKLLNYGDLREYLVEKEFNEFIPESQSVTNQVNQFFCADIVVAQAGAVLGNIMFMRPGTKVIALAAQNEYQNDSYFQDYAKIFGVDLVFVHGIPSKKFRANIFLIGSDRHPLNSDFEINLDLLNFLI